MLDEKKDYVTKSKAKVIVNTLSKYNEKKKLATIYAENKILYLKNRRTKRGKQKMKSVALCSVVIETNN